MRLSHCIVLIFCSAALLFGESERRTRFGLSGHAGLHGGGGGARLLLLNERLDMTVGGYWHWPAEESSAQGTYAQIGWHFPLGEQFSLYPFVAPAMHRHLLDTTINETPVRRDMQFFSAIIGGGAEYRFGFDRQHALALQAGFRRGTSDYTYASRTLIGDSSFVRTTSEYALNPVTAEVKYSYFFGSAKRRDSDGDGLLDREDLCPHEVGLAQFQGCPNPDRDGDGICDPWVSDQGLSAKFAHLCSGSDRCPDVAGVAEEQGCVKPAPVVVVETAVKVVETPVEVATVVETPVEIVTVVKEEPVVVATTPLSVITFAANRSTLSHSSIPVLEAMVKTLTANPNLQLRLEGYSDSSGDPATNQQISLERAKMAKLYLTNSGIAEDRITVVGFGSDKPVGDNTDFYGRRKNRRVEMWEVVQE